jgi:DNA uptake protein ComE-like DNA-binding protein|tara:strand:- start:1917 stop:2333 length:417 start_codon:yes stop_codon:yes gene_type:complete
MTTLFKHKKTGARVKIISELDNGDCFMVEDQDSRTFYAYKHELETDPEGTKKVKTLQIKDKASKEEPRDFPPETRLNINGATAQMIADHIKGIGLKTAREIKDIQMSLSGEKFANLEQLRQIKRVDWDSVFAADLIRV